MAPTGASALMASPLPINSIAHPAVDDSVRRLSQAVWRDVPVSERTLAAGVERARGLAAGRVAREILAADAPAAAGSPRAEPQA